MQSPVAVGKGIPTVSFWSILFSAAGEIGETTSASGKLSKAKVTNFRPAVSKMFTGQLNDGRQTKLTNSKPKLTRVYEVSMLFAVIRDRKTKAL